ncbi:MAG TPA: hypothetical protein VM094_01020 [Gemmatimonadales bacterium]|nr:hypothetical protein [Gemmatimonadales bacterium]
MLIGLWMVAEALSDGLLGIRTAIAPIECGPKANIVEGMMEAAEILGKEIGNAVTYHAVSNIN